MKNVYLFLIQALMALSLMWATGCSKGGDGPDPSDFENVGEESIPSGGSDTGVSLTTDPGVKINGVIWATRNVDKPGTFTANPEDPGMFYQWNSKVGWRYTDPLTPSDGTSTWNPNWNGNGATTWEKANDPCPPGWRVPTGDELLSLVGSRTNATVNGMNGFWCGTTGAVVFLPCAGDRYGNSGSGNNKGSYVELAAASPFGTFNYYGRYISGNVSAPSTLGPAAALSVRCVKE